MTQPFVEDAELPYPHQPIIQLPRINPLVHRGAFQYREGNEARCAEWCGGVVWHTEDGPLVQVPTTEGPVLARLGDWVLTDGGEVFWVEPAEGFHERWWPLGRTPDWEWRCYQPWEQQPDPNEPSDPHIADGELPYVHQPVELVGWMDNSAEFDAFQNRPLVRSQLALWCGGVLDGMTVVLPDGTDVPIGDWVLTDGSRFWAERGDGFHQRYWPADRDPGFSHRCFYEGPIDGSTA